MLEFFKIPRLTVKQTYQTYQLTMAMLALIAHLEGDYEMGNATNILLYLYEGICPNQNDLLSAGLHAARAYDARGHIYTPGSQLPDLTALHDAINHGGSAAYRLSHMTTNSFRNVAQRVHQWRHGNEDTVELDREEERNEYLNTP